MKTLAFYVDLQREEARAMATRTAALGRELGYAIAMCEAQNDRLPLSDTGANVEDAQLLLTVGGDGTLLRGARIAYPYDIPLLGINAGRLGFLTEVDANGATPGHIAALLSDGFIIEERAVLQATLTDGRTFVALNDVVVRKGLAARVAPFGLELDGEHVADLPSDGIVIATPTGSTAYFLSAGGPIIAPGVEAFGIATLLAHTLFARPLIVPTSSTIVITCDSEVVGADLEADGEIVADLKPGASITITRAQKTLRFARSRPLQFFTRLEQKLRWGAPLRGR